MDIGNAALAIECPNCGLVTSRFLQYCKNCGFALWPNGPYASAAFEAWRQADPSRAGARRYDVELPAGSEAQLIDYDSRAHELGIHVSPPSRYPFVICIGFFFLALAAIPFSAPARIGLAAIGGIIFLIGVFGWVVLEDVRNYPHEDAASGHGSQGSGGSGHPAPNVHGPNGSKEAD